MLELSSNTIKVLGIFGRLSPETEATFDKLEGRYSKKSAADTYDIFRHLTITFIPNATVREINSQLDLLHDLKLFLPLKIRIKDFFVKDEESMPGAQHIAIEFNLSETKELVDFVQKKAGDTAVATWYIKAVWFVPKENQQTVINELSSITELEFTDFYLCSNKQDEANTIYKTSQFDASRND